MCVYPQDGPIHYWPTVSAIKALYSPICLLKEVKLGIKKGDRANRDTIRFNATCVETSHTLAKFLNHSRRDT